MAHLLEPDTPPTMALDGLPAELAVCWVEDWCPANDPGIVDLVGASQSAGRSVQTDRMVARMVVARGRWTEARRLWAELHDVDPGLLPSSAPRWRRPPIEE